MRPGSPRVLPLAAGVGLLLLGGCSKAPPAEGSPASSLDAAASPAEAATTPAAAPDAAASPAAATAENAEGPRAARPTRVQAPAGPVVQPGVRTERRPQPAPSSAQVPAFKGKTLALIHTANLVGELEPCG